MFLQGDLGSPSVPNLPTLSCFGKLEPDYFAPMASLLSNRYLVTRFSFLFLWTVHWKIFCKWTFQTFNLRYIPMNKIMKIIIQKLNLCCKKLLTSKDSYTRSFRSSTHPSDFFRNTQRHICPNVGNNNIHSVELFVIKLILADLASLC